MPPRKVVREVFLIDGKFGKYKTSLSTSSRLLLLRGAHQIPHQIPLISPEPTVCPENPPPGHTCVFEIFFSLCVGIALPQLCPNVIRTVLCLITLAEEDRFSPSLNDLLQLYAKRNLRRERAEQEKARIKSDKTVMAGTLEDNKLRSLEKSKYQQSDSRSRSRQTTNKASVSAGKKPETPTSGSGKTIKDPARKDSEKRAADKKRKQPEETNPSPPRSSRPRHEEKGAKLKGIVKEAPQNLVVCLLENLKPANRNVATSLFQLILEFNSVFCSHEDQLSNKDVEIESFKRSEDENAKAVEKANKVMNRMKAAELQVQKLEVNNIDLTAKLEAGKNAYLDAIEKETQARADLRTCEEKMKKMEEEQAEMIAAARTDERRKVRAQFHDFSSKYRNFFKESEEVETLKV
ncbi:hypothetical protein ISN45_At02g008860 [Arabidopsis thaliana x Arabidopsis arenosa]|uniref:Uncharacterized protein n=1 Tax=Arabidopsis thaliana x Arabidopsis arenosa TaxID=1240361 RepID=A0A8T2FIU4_9BRAS|nr:hypothetical protein ISN45_At02g008860 [Arabidopsis thaliana x Arabidopsis arenosa]